MLFGCLAIAIVGLLVYGLFLKDDEVPEAHYVVSSDEEDVVLWNGQEYTYNDHLSNYVFIGVDEYELKDGDSDDMQAGSSDSLFLLSYDRVTKDMTIVSIPRDTMTDIEVFLKDGTSAGISRNHISLSYSYGDGKHKSCQMTEDAVSNLFYGLPITGYCAMSMSGLAVIPDAIGSFEVVVPNDSLSGRYEGYEKGSTVTITSENSELFVRSRDIGEEHSAIYRQERQEAYLDAAFAQVETQYEKSPEIVTELYEALSSYLVTNMGNDLFVELMDSAYSGAEVTTCTVPGESVVGEQYDEYHVDDDALYEMVIETFYDKVEQ